MVETIKKSEGGCFCDAIRYTIIGPPDFSTHCHCRSCQRAVGAAFASWVGVTTENFKVTRGQIAICNWHGVERGFCGKCGTSLTYMAEEEWPGAVSILAPTLDDPGFATPGAHVYTEHQLPWIKLDDGLPQYEQFP